MEPIHIPRLCRFHPGKFLPKLLYGSPGARAFLLCLEPGQRLPVRVDSEEVLCYLVEGRALFQRGEAEFALEAGDFVAAKPGERRGIEARERTVALWIHIVRGDELD